MPPDTDYDTNDKPGLQKVLEFEYLFDFVWVKTARRQVIPEEISFYITAQF